MFCRLRWFVFRSISESALVARTSELLFVLLKGVLSTDAALLGSC